MNLEDRFWSKVEPTGFCWNWTRGKSHGGYGTFSVGGKRVKAHRVAWELLMGPIPEGLEPDHLCRNRACVNPDHIEWVTKAENVRRSFGPAWAQAQRTHCPQGHEYSEENTYVYTYGRYCRQCSFDRKAVSRAQEKDQKNPPKKSGWW